MCRVSDANGAVRTSERKKEARPPDQHGLMEGLRTQLVWADALGFDLVALRIAEAIDQLVADIACNRPGEGDPVLQ